MTVKLLVLAFLVAISCTACKSEEKPPDIPDRSDTVDVESFVPPASTVHPAPIVPAIKDKPAPVESEPEPDPLEKELAVYAKEALKTHDIYIGTDEWTALDQANLESQLMELTKDGGPWVQESLEDLRVPSAILTDEHLDLISKDLESIKGAIEGAYRGIEMGYEPSGPRFVIGTLDQDKMDTLSMQIDQLDASQRVFGKYVVDSCHWDRCTAESIFDSTFPKQVYSPDGTRLLEPCDFQNQELYYVSIDFLGITDVSLELYFYSNGDGLAGQSYYFPLDYWEY